MIRPTRKTGVVTVLESLKKHGWVSSISKVQVVEVMPNAPPADFRLLRAHLAGAEAQGGTVQFTLSSFPHSNIRKFTWLDGNHRMAALEQLLAEQWRCTRRYHLF